MSIHKKVYEEITIIHSEKERDKATKVLDKGNWRIQYAGPVIKDLPIKHGKFKIDKFKIVAYRLLK